MQAFRAASTALQREAGHVLNTDHELDRQHEALHQHGLPRLVGLAEDMFTDAVEGLRPALRDFASQSRASARFVLGVSGGAANDVEAAEQAVPLLRVSGGSLPGVLDRHHGERAWRRIAPSEEVGPPPAPVYALVDVERGEEFCGVPPQDALPVLLGRSRTPLTILEGIVSVLLYPQALERRLASCCPARVAATAASRPCGSQARRRSRGGVGTATPTHG